MTGLPLDPDDPDARLAFMLVLTRTLSVRPREAEALWHLMRGVTASADLMAQLCVQPGTIKGYFWRVFPLLDARDRTQVVLKLWPTYVRAKRQGAAIAPLAREAA